MTKLCPTWDKVLLTNSTFNQFQRKGPELLTRISRIIHSTFNSQPSTKLCRRQTKVGLVKTPQFAILLTDFGAGKSARVPQFNRPCRNSKS
jgi:hypothetical protein